VVTPSLNVPVALKARVVPGAIVGFTGVIRSVAIAMELIVTVVCPVIPFRRA
jgi:hypothetical protein